MGERNCRPEVFSPRKFGTQHKLLFIHLYLKWTDRPQKFYKRSLKFLNTICLYRKNQYNITIFTKHCRELNTIISAPVISNKVKDKHLKQEILAHRDTKQSYLFSNNMEKQLNSNIYLSLLFFIPSVYKALTFLSLGLTVTAQFYSETCLKILNN